MINEQELPDGWKKCILKDIGKVISGGTPSSKEITYWGSDIAWITPADLSGYTAKHISKGRKSISNAGLNNSSARILPKGSVLFSSRAPIGYVAIARDDLTTNQGFKSIVPNADIDSDYLYYYLKLNKQLAIDSASGTTFKEISGAKFSELPFMYPQISEQLQIVQKIEELFSELDKGIENLKTAQQQLKVYRQGVLKWAFEGKLTNDNVKDGELPERWAKLPVGTVIEKPTYGTSKKCDYRPVGRGVLRIPNIINGIVDASDLKYAEFDKSEINAYNLKDGDLLIIRSNGSVNIVGKCALITNKEENFLYAGYLIRLRPIKKSVNPKYLSYVLSSNNLRNQIENKAKSTSGVNNINANELKDLIITICSIDEQSKVVQEIESRLCVCDNIEETLNYSLLQAEALRQSILKKAFEGKLVKAQIKPLYKPKNTYFYQMQLLGIVAAASKEKGINHGEMTIAKYAYLLDKVYQIPTYYDYKRWHLGPYPPEIKKAINNAKFFTKKNNAIEVKDIDTLTKYTNPYSDKLKNAVDDLSDIFAKYTGKDRSHQIELLATVCKAIEDTQSIDLKAIRASMTEWKIDLATTNFKSKAEKFTEQETIECLALISDRGWDKSLMAN